MLARSDVPAGMHDKNFSMAFMGAIMAVIKKAWEVESEKRQADQLILRKFYPTRIPKTHSQCRPVKTAWAESVIGMIAKEFLEGRTGDVFRGARAVLIMFLKTL